MARTCACFNLRSASRAVSAFFDARFEAVGLKATQYTVLAALLRREQDAPTVTHLAEALILDQSSLSRTLSVLDRDGLVRLTPGREDRRERVVSLTRKGRAAVARGLPVWREVQDAVAKAYGGGDFEAQLRGLRRLTRAVQALDASRAKDTSAAKPRRGRR